MCGAALEVPGRSCVTGDHALPSGPVPARWGTPAGGRDGRWLLYYDTLDHLQCRVGPFPVLPTYVRLSPDGATLATLDEQGRLRLFRTSDGAGLCAVDLPEVGKVLAFTPDSQRIVLGGFRGSIRCYDLAGQPAWPAVRLGDANDILGEPLPLYDAAFPDFTDRLWPSSRDAEGELDAVVRMGVNRLVNGDCQSEGGWMGEAVAYHPEGYQSGRSLKVGPGMVGQEVSGFLGQHATWVLEFFYRAPPTRAARQVAGRRAGRERLSRFGGMPFPLLRHHPRAYLPHRGQIDL